MVNNMKDFTDQERLLILEQYVEEFKKRIDSYHYDVKAGDGRIEKKLEKVQNDILKDVKLIFIEESRKISGGIGKRIDKLDERMDKTETHISRTDGFVKGAKWMIGFIMTALAFLGIQIV